MEKTNIEDVPHLSIREMAILPIETLLDLEIEAKAKLVAASKQISWINGAIAIRNIRNEKAMNGGLV
ncbi:MAG: hypothetical protein WBJ81_05010 [Rickettsiales bacterium]